MSNDWWLQGSDPIHLLFILCIEMRLIFLLYGFDSGYSLAQNPWGLLLTFRTESKSWAGLQTLPSNCLSPSLGLGDPRPFPQSPVFHTSTPCCPSLDLPLHFPLWVRPNSQAIAWVIAFTISVIGIYISLLHKTVSICISMIMLYNSLHNTIFYLPHWVPNSLCVFIFACSALPPIDTGISCNIDWTGKSELWVVYQTQWSLVNEVAFILLMKGCLLTFVQSGQVFLSYQAIDHASETNNTHAVVCLWSRSLCMQACGRTYPGRCSDFPSQLFSKWKEGIG